MARRVERTSERLSEQALYKRVVALRTRDIHGMGTKVVAYRQWHTASTVSISSKSTSTTMSDACVQAAAPGGAAKTAVIGEQKPEANVMRKGGASAGGVAGERATRP